MTKSTGGRLRMKYKDIDEVFNPIIDSGEGKVYWSERAVKLMLVSVAELQGKVGKSITLKTKAKMHAIVSERMAEENNSFTPTKIENRFRGMERQYKKTVLNNRQTGRNKQICPLEKELKQVMGKKMGINPGFTLENRFVDGMSRSVSGDENIGSDVEQVLSDNTPRCSSQGAKRRKIGPQHEALQKLDQILEEKREFHTKVLEVLKQKGKRAEQNMGMSKEKCRCMKEKWSCSRCW